MNKLKHTIQYIQTSVKQQIAHVDIQREVHLNSSTNQLNINKLQRW